MKLSEKTGNRPDLAASQNELSFQFRRRKEFDKAFDLSGKAVSNFLASGMPFHAMNALINQSTMYIVLRNYKTALETLAKATRLSPLWKNPNLYMRIYGLYSNVYRSLGDYKSAYEFEIICSSLQVEFFKNRINSQINEQSARFDLFVKEQKIREQQKKNEYNHRQIIFLVIISVALTLIFIFSLFYFRLRRQGAMKQKLIEAVVETETNERRRIARDLHDGLGPVLSAINHYFQAFLDAKPGTREAIQSRLQSVISEAIDEVSRISHNISPHVLEKHGLMTALNNLFAPLVAGGRYEIHFNFGIVEKLDPKIELTIYRCITELLNNTMKHAEATEITLRIRPEGDRLLIHYSDNGKGFIPAAGKKDGMGLSNITNRVESIGGTVLVLSSPNAGVAFNISLPV